MSKSVPLGLHSPRFVHVDGVDAYDILISTGGIRYYLVTAVLLCKLHVPSGMSFELTCFVKSSTREVQYQVHNFGIFQRVIQQAMHNTQQSIGTLHIGQLCVSTVVEPALLYQIVDVTIVPAA